jgi:hypothetical protein
MPELKTLQLDYNRINFFPPGWTKWTNTEIHIKQNPILNIPQEFLDKAKQIDSSKGTDTDPNPQAKELTNKIFHFLLDILSLKTVIRNKTLEINFFFKKNK